MLTQEMIGEVYRAAISACLDRDATLAALDRRVVAKLPRAPDPGGQILVDLHELNRIGQLSDGTMPLRTWLKTALILVGPLLEAEVFQRSLVRLPPGSIPQGPAVSPDAGERTSGVPGRVKVLLLGANPSDTERLAVGRELREIYQRLRNADMRDAFHVEQACAVTPAELQERLLRHRPTIVHFIGHGNAAGQLLLEDEAGLVLPVSSSALAELFRILRQDIRCVILNACFTAVQANAIAEHIDCVIGMSTAIDDSSAISFASAFYEALGNDRDLHTAFALGCNRIELLGLAHADAPRLLARDGVQLETIRLASSKARG